MTHAEVHTHDHPSHVAHHWDSAQQQFDAGKLGMWLFLATEVLLFGGLFCAYVVWRYLNPELFAYGSQFLDTTMGAINTAVLIVSSLTMATAVTMAQLGRKRELIICLVLTLLGAFGFLVIKYFEYSHKFNEGFFPGIRFYEKPAHAHTWDPDGGIAGLEMTAIDPTGTALTVAELGLPEGLPVEPSTVGPPAEASSGISVLGLMEMEAKRHRREVEATHPGEGESLAQHEHEAEHGPTHPLQDPHRPDNAHMFFNIYFMMTGLHGIHVVIGGIVITWLIIGAARGRFNKDYFTPVDLGGLYWHVVDLIWIFLFPLFYLI